MKKVIIFILLFSLFLPFVFAGDEDDNPNSSVNLVKKAAECLKAEDYKNAKKYAKKCIILYKSKALQMQKKLAGFPEGEAIYSYWALNDVAYAYFLLGEVYRKQGNVNSAKRMYEYVIKKLKYAQIYDPNLNDFWKVADACKEKLRMLKFNENSSENNSGVNKFDLMKKKIEEMKKKGRQRLR